MGLKESLESFMKKRYALPLVFLLTIGIDLLLLTMATCYTVVLISILTFAIPYYVGLRDVKKFFVVGVLAFLIITLAWAPIFLSQAQPPVNSPSSGAGNIMGATVSPYRGTADTPYNFTATVYAPGGAPVVWLNYQKIGDKNTTTVAMQVAERGINSSTYTCYYASTLDEGVYYFNINVSTAAGNVSTPPRPGPINTDFNGAYMAFLPVVLYESGVMLFLFIILLMIFWWSQKAREEKLKKYPEPELDESEDEEIFYCSSCGAPVKASDLFCPKCGEPLEDDDESEEGSEGEEGAE